VPTYKVFLITVDGEDVRAQPCSDLKIQRHMFRPAEPELLLRKMQLKSSSTQASRQKPNID
jgi:hypothetical protein